MGCCVSSHKASVPSSAKGHCSLVASQPPRSSVSRVKALDNRAPPPVEEETVKEVLSETPKCFEPKKQPQYPIFEKTQRGRQNTASLLPIYKVQEPETSSEVCSLSESVSTATIADKREDDEEQVPKRVYGSPANLSKNQSFTSSKREKVVGKSPSRRSEISPGRRNTGFGSGSMRFVQSRDPLNQNTTIASRNPTTEPKKRDLGEQSGRRSRSPATRTDNGVPKSLVGRSPSARRTNPSPGRSRMAQADHDGGNSVRKSEQSRRDNKWTSTNESLENPLVSLECFIFL